MLEDNAMTNNTIIKNNEKLIRLFFIPFSSCRILETRSSFDTSGHLWVAFTSVLKREFIYLFAMSDLFFQGLSKQYAYQQSF